MAKFIYTVRDRDGKINHGFKEALNKDSVVSSLQDQGFFIISITEQEEFQKSKDKKLRRRLHRQVRMDDLILFARQLATMVSSGVTLLRSLEVLSQQVESRPLYLAVREVMEDVEGGATFKDALDKQPKIFSKFWVNLVETGEASGHLPTALDQLAHYLEASGILRKKIISALIYPIVLVCMAILTMFIFLVKIIPLFADIFKNFEVQLPLLTRIVIGFSSLLRTNVFYLMFVLIALGYILTRYIRTERGKKQFDAFKLRLPIFGQLLQWVAIERFASGLSTLVSSGVPILYSLEIMAKTAGNKVVEEELEIVRDKVREGKTLAQPLADSQVFTPMVVQMVNVGEEIGELGKMLENIASFYEEHITTFVSRLTTMFEPFVLVLMGIVVGTLVVAMFLPIFSLASIARG